MILLNYQKEIWTKITQDNKSWAEWTEHKKYKKNKGIDNLDKKNVHTFFFAWTIFFSGHFFLSGQFFGWEFFFVRTIFLSGQKGIYHHVELLKPSQLALIIRKSIRGSKNITQIFAM